MQLAAHRVDVWWAGLHDGHSELLELLDPAEQVRLHAYRQPVDRVRFVLGCAMVRLAVAKHTAKNPRSVRLERRCTECGEPHGKVVIAGADGLQTSVSHSGGAVGVAMARDTPVGLDIEASTPSALVDIPGLAPHVLAPCEEEQLRTLSYDRRLLGLLRSWTRKEAILKATGHGLSLPMTGIVLGAPDQEPVLLRWVELPHMVGRMKLVDLAAVEGHLASLAVVGHADIDVREIPGSVLLGRGRRGPSLAEAVA